MPQRSTYFTIEINTYIFQRSLFTMRLSNRANITLLYYLQFRLLEKWKVETIKLGTLENKYALLSTRSPSETSVFLSEIFFSCHLLLYNTEPKIVFSVRRIPYRIISYYFVSILCSHFSSYYKVNPAEFESRRYSCFAAVLPHHLDSHFLLVFAIGYIMNFKSF